MKILTGRLLTAIILGSLSFGFPAHTVVAQETPPAADSQLLNELRERLQRLEQELEALKNSRSAQVPADKAQQRVVVMLESPYLGRYYNRSTNSRHSRFFAAKLNLVNLTPDALDVKREQIQLVADGTTKTLGEIPASIQNQGFQLDNQYHQLRNMQPAKKLNVPPGGMQSTWVVFDGLDDGAHVPEMTLKIELADKVAELDVNASQKDALGLEIERIGPRGALGLVTIGGKLNTINIGSLMDDLDQLSMQKVVRVVLRWDDAAPQPDQQLLAWIVQNANSLNANRGGSDQFPAIPATLREFHLCKIPKGDSSRMSRYTSRSGGTRRVHDSEGEAVQAALACA